MYIHYVMRQWTAVLYTPQQSPSIRLHVCSRCTHVVNLVQVHDHRVRVHSEIEWPEVLLLKFHVKYGFAVQENKYK